MKVAAALLVSLLAAPALAAPGGTDVERAATRTARALDGVLRACPASFARVGSADKRCVGVQGTVEEARVRLGGALGGDLFGVWRSRDGQRSVYNWVRTPGGYVYLRLQPDPEGRAQTLVYLDMPPTGTGQGAAGNSAPPRASSPRPATPRPSAPAREATSSTLAPTPFTRSLGVQNPRLNGADVRAVQDRLIALTRPSGGGRGDGWYGPVTAATVRAFQAANGLPVTGRVDRGTWNVLFSRGARTFSASDIR